MSEEETYIREAIRQWVWSGFYDADDVHEMLEDIMEEEVDEAAMHAAIDNAFAHKAEAEKAWPDETDCDRLDAVFQALDESGICCVQNAGYTMSEGYAEIAEVLEDCGRDKFYGYCFYHGQDLERVIDGGGLMLAFGDLDDDAAKSVEIGRKVCAAFNAAGFETDWDETADTRINLSQIDWKRRG